MGKMQLNRDEIKPNISNVGYYDHCK